MVSVITRNGKGSPLTAAEMDQNLLGLAAAINAIQSARGKVQAVTPLLAPGATAYLDMPLGRTYILHAVQTDFPALVRTYVSSAHRAADAGRAVGVMPTNDHGIVDESVMGLGYLTVQTTPIPVGGNHEAAPSSLAFVAVTNKDVVARNITLTVDRLSLEL